jgi:hypothetical protein
VTAVSVVIPTIRGREELFEQTVTGLEDTTHVDLQLIVVRDRPTCGEAWNEGASLAGGDYLMLATDDMLPHAGWSEAACDAADADVYPAPWIKRLDGSTECCGTLGCGLLLGEDARDGLPVCNSPIPFMRRKDWPLVGPSIPAHCYSDDYLGYKARLAGLSVEVRRAYLFTHLDGQVGHAPLVARAMSDRAMFAEAVTKL